MTGTPKSLRQTEDGFVEAVSKPSREELRKFYADKYYQDCISSSYSKEYSPEELTYLRNKDHESVEISKRYFGSELMGKKFLDVGCGEGFTMKHFKLQGCEVVGVDYSDFALRYHNPGLMPYFHKGDLLDFIERSIEDGKRFDIVNLDNVLEHVLDPVGLLMSLGSLVEEGGIMRIQVPNDFSPCQLELLRQGKVTDCYWVTVPEHISYFNVESMRKLLSALQYRILTVTGDFPIDFSLFNDRTDYLGDRGVGESCHISKVLIENFLYQVDFDRSTELFELLGTMGIGRIITFYVVK